MAFLLLVLLLGIAPYTATSKSLQVRVFGDKELEAAFRALSFGAQKKVFRPALRAGGKVLLAATKDRVPVDLGYTKRAIKMKPLTRSRRRIGVSIFVDKNFLPTTRLKAKDGHETFPPAAIELGYVAGGKRRETRWVSSGIDSLGRRYSRRRVTRTREGGTYVPPRSFMRAGFDAAKEAALAAIEAEAGKRIDDLWLNPPKNLQLLRTSPDEESAVVE